MITSIVAILFFVRCPANIVRYVITVIILTIYGILVGWPRLNVSEKVVKAKEPSIANGNPSSSVVLITEGIRIVATTLHAQPDSILGWVCMFRILCSHGRIIPYYAIKSKLMI